MRVQEKDAGAGSSRSTTDSEKSSDMASTLDIPLSTSATIGATTAETVPTIDRTTIEESRGQSEDPHDDLG